MNFNSFLVTDTSGKKSLTATVFLLGVLVVNLKLLLSGIVIHSFTIRGMVVPEIAISLFSGTEYGVAMTALGGIYILRRNTDKTLDSKTDG